MNTNEQSIASNTRSTSISKYGDFDLHSPSGTVKRLSKPTLMNPVIPLNQLLTDPEGPNSILTVHIKNNRLSLFDGELSK